MSSFQPDQIVPCYECQPQETFRDVTNIATFEKCGTVQLTLLPVLRNSLWIKFNKLHEKIDLNKTWPSHPSVCPKKR